MRNTACPRELPSARREAYANQVGADGWRILEALEQLATPTWLRDLPAIVTLRQVWAQQYHPRHPTDPETGPAREGRKGRTGRTGTWRPKEEVPPASQIPNSPYDPEARYGKKREFHWVGYKAHLTQTLTETCDPEAPRLVVQATTTVGSASDEATLPLTHLVDAGDSDADGLAAAQRRVQVDVVGPSDARELSLASTGPAGLRRPPVPVDWDAHRATVPSAPRDTPVSPGDPAMTDGRGGCMR